MRKKGVELADEFPTCDVSSHRHATRQSVRWLALILFVAAGVSLMAASLWEVSHRIIWLGNAALMTVTMFYAVSVWIAHRRRSTNVLAALDRLQALRVEERSERQITFRDRVRPPKLDS